MLAALMAGQSVSATSRQFRVSRSTIHGWRAAAGLQTAPVDQQKREELGDLIGDLLKAILTTLRFQAEHFRDKSWLTGQPASEVAVLFGVMADKAFRILEAADTTDTPAVPDLP